MTQEETINQLKNLIQTHKVCYEVWQENLMVIHQIVQVGFDLELEGTHQHPGSEVQPGCPHCLEVYKDLQRIAEWILPTEDRPTIYEIEPFDGAIYYPPRRKLRPEVWLNIKIIHRHGFDQPVDDCEQRCLKEMRQRLAELGVKEGAWKDERQ